jgi:sterol desaturase/sphingolipid hydroxylase (fatty acid hydroxylase superfamily)
MDNLILYAIPFFIGTVILEAIFSFVRKLKLYEKRDTFASLSMGIGNVIISTTLKLAVVPLYFFMHQFAIFDLGPHLWWAWVLMVLAEDFTYYWWHRASHEVRFLWAAHVNHHSSEHYNLSTALRQSWTTPFTFFWLYLPLPLLGFHPGMLLTAQAISLLYQYWIHTETIRSLGPLEAVMNTPSHHRVHHGSNLRYLDRNHAGIFIIWDRLFGSFEPEGEKVKYGLTTNIDTFNPVKIAFHEWKAIAADVRRAKSFGEALGYIFMPPGWSPDGSTLTANQMRAQLAYASQGGLPASAKPMDEPGIVDAPMDRPPTTG